MDVADRDENLSRATKPRSAEPGAAIFVWGGWAVMTAVAAGFIVSYGPNLPRWDDFAMVDVLVGTQRVTVDWLWSLHNEHRLPLPKLILVLLSRISGNDFRAGMFFNVAALATLAGASISIAARRPGGCRTCDLLFPLVLLNLSHSTNLLWSWQVQFVASTVIAGAVILLIVSRADWPGAGTAVVVGLCLALLSLCGANGVALVPALDCWLLAATIAHWRSGRVGGKRRAFIVLLAAVPGIVLTVLYFKGYHPTAQHPGAGELEAALRTSLQFISLMFGTEAPHFWPASGMVALTVIATSIAILAFVAIRGRPNERPRALGLLCTFGAMGCLALGMGWGRAGSGEQSGFEARYVTLVAPLWLIVIFTWDIFTSEIIRRVALTTAFSAALILIWPFTSTAIEAARNLDRQADQFLADVKEGAPIHVLTRRYTPILHSSQDVLAEKLAQLRTAHIGAFGKIRSDPPFREAQLPVTPADVKMARWENGTAYITKVDPSLHYILPSAQRICGIRLKYSHTNKVGGPAHFRIMWTSVAGTEPGPAQVYSNWSLPSGQNKVTTLWVEDTVKEFWLQPDNQACEFSIGEITLLSH